MKPKGVLVVTVGTSALTARRLGDPISGSVDESQAAAELRRSIQDYLGNLQAGGAAETDLFEEILNAHRSLWESIRFAPSRLVSSAPPIGDRIDTTSAEMTSTYFLRLTGAVPDGFLGRNWRVVLLASSTPEGQLAARLNARLIHDYLLRPRCECTSTNKAACNKGRVVVVTVQGLDERGFTGSVSQNLLDALDASRAEQVICNITGGFKGTIPIVTVWASRHAFPLFYQHERAKECVRIAFDAHSRLIEEKRYSLGAFPTPENLG